MPSCKQLVDDIEPNMDIDMDVDQCQDKANLNSCAKIFKDSGEDAEDISVGCKAPEKFCLQNLPFH